MLSPPMRTVHLAVLVQELALALVLALVPALVAMREAGKSWGSLFLPLMAGLRKIETSSRSNYLLNCQLCLLHRTALRHPAHHWTRAPRRLVQMRTARLEVLPASKH